MRISDWSSDVCSSDLSMTVISDVDYVAHPDPRLPFSAAVRVGDVVHLSGQIGVREDGTLPDDIAGQAHQAMRNLADAARRAGTSLHRVVKCTVMLADIDRKSAVSGKSVSGGGN